MKARIVLVTALLATGVVLLPLLATAARLELPDPNDQKGILDIKQVNFWGNEKPGWKVITFKEWKAKRLYDRGHVIVWLDTRRGERPEYFALVRSNADGEMRARLYRDRKKKDDKKKGTLNVWRKSRHSVSVTVPLSKLNFGDERTYYEWYVQTLWSNDNCKRVCFDFAPDKGEHRIRVPRPGLEPTPTPTPSGPVLGPTPSPSESPSPSPSESPTPTPSPFPLPTPS